MIRAKDVVAELVANAVCKIQKLEEEFEFASEWLKDNGYESLFLRGEAHKSVNDTVHQLCPRYRKLSRVFGCTDCEKEMSGEAAQKRKTDAPDLGCGMQKKQRPVEWLELNGVDSSWSKQEIVNPRLVECDIEHKRAMSKCHLEGEQKREEIRTKCEIILARHKLLSPGVDEEEVDSVFPLEY